MNVEGCSLGGGRQDYLGQHFGLGNTTYIGEAHDFEKLTASFADPARDLSKDAG